MDDYKYILRYNSVEKVLDVPPAGWDTWVRRYFRHGKLGGILMSDAVSQRFVFTDGYLDSGGGYFIEDAFESEGVKAVIEFERQKLNPYTKIYTTDYTGILDMSDDGGYKEQDEWIEVMTIDSGKLQDFISNIKTDYNLNSLIATNGNSITPFSNSPKQCSYRDVDVYVDALSSGDISVIRTGYPSDSPSGTEAYDATYSYNRIGDRVIISGEKIYENSTDDNVDWNFELKGSLDYTTTYIPDPTAPSSDDLYADIDVDIYLRIYDSADILITSIVVDSKSDGVSQPEENITNEITDSIDYNYQYEMLPGYYVVFRMEYDTDGFRVDLDFDWILSIESLLMYEKTFIQGVTAYSYLTHEVATRLAQLMTGETDTSKLIDAEIFGRIDSEFKTYLTDGRLAYLATTSGWALRKYPEYTIKVNFLDWFDTVSKMANIAVYYDKENDLIKIVDKADVYKNEEMFELTTVNNSTTILHSESYFSTIKGGGSEKGDYEKSNGAYEYNIQSTFSVDMPSVDALDMRTPYNTDTLSAAFAIASQYFTEGIEDTKYDDKIMITELNSTLETIRNSDIGTFTGYLGVQDKWNGNYTPGKCIKNNGNWLGACFYKTPGGFIQFTGNSKDTLVTSDGVSEADNITVVDLGEPLYFPEVVTIDAAITTEMINELDSDPHRYITYPDKYGNKQQGQVIDAEVNEFKKEGKFTLIKNNPNR